MSISRERAPSAPTTGQRSGGRWASYLVPIVALACVAGAYITRDRWLEFVTPKKLASDHPAVGDGGHEGHDHGATDRVKLTDAARANLGIRSKAVKVGDFWRTLMIPGAVIDRPGHSDRGVTAPAMSVVAEIQAKPGDALKPGDPIVTLRVVSELVMSAQAELFKNAQEIQLATEQVERLRPLREQGAVAGSALIEKEQQLRRAQTQAVALRQELAARGLTKDQIDRAAKGEFLREMAVKAPPVPTLGAASAPPSSGAPSPFFFEVEELRVNLGDQVQAGQTLAVLANHSQLLVEGHAFRADTGLVERAAREAYPVLVEFVQTTPGDWSGDPVELTISHLANTVDPQTRTTSFFLPLVNEGRPFERDGKTAMIWRYRPGQRVKLRVPVEKLTDVIVLPPDAVTFDGPDAYVFRQNGDTFQRVAVHVVYADATAAVIANDGQVGPGMFVAQSGAAALNRAVRAALSGGSGGGHDHAGHDHAH